MAAEAKDVEKLVRAQRNSIATFFGVQVPPAPDRLFEIAEKIRQERLFNNPRILFAPRRSFPEGMTFPGQRVPMSPNLYRYIREGWVEKDADSLPGKWMIFDTTQAADYNSGKQMYRDTPQFKGVLAGVRNQHPEISKFNPRVPKQSRFGFSADEIDGSDGFIAREVANILKLQPDDEITTPPYSVFYYIGNLDPSLKLGEFTVSEWFRNIFRHGVRLGGGVSRYGGLSCVNDWRSDDRHGSVGFRFQIVPSQAA